MPAPENFENRSYVNWLERLLMCFTNGVYKPTDRYRKVETLKQDYLSKAQEHYDEQIAEHISDPDHWPEPSESTSTYRIDLARKLFETPPERIYQLAKAVEDRFVNMSYMAYSYVSGEEGDELTLVLQATFKREAEALRKELEG